MTNASAATPPPNVALAANKPRSSLYFFYCLPTCRQQEQENNYSEMEEIKKNLKEVLVAFARADPQAFDQTTTRKYSFAVFTLGNHYLLLKCTERSEIPNYTKVSFASLKKRDVNT